MNVTQSTWGCLVAHYTTVYSQELKKDMHEHLLGHLWHSTALFVCFFCSKSHLLPPSEGVIYLSACRSYPKEDKYLTFFSPIKWITVHDTPDDLSRHTNVPQHTHSVAWHFVYLFSPKHHTSRWQCVKKNIRYEP